MKDMFTVHEQFNGFRVEHNPSGDDHWLSDGVDCLFDENDEAMLPGGETFCAIWTEQMNANEGETLEAYFPQHWEATIKEEIGTSGKFVTFMLTDDAEEDIKTAVDLEHTGTDFTDSCDICQAYQAGFIFTSAHLLLGATTTPLLDAVCKHYYKEMYGEEPRGWPTDWDDWTEYFREHCRECIKCGAFVSCESHSCDNCLQKLEPIQMAGSESVQVDDTEEFKCFKLNVPQWYKREDFMAWLNKYCPPQKGVRGHATWHQGGKATEYSDVFVVWDHGEGTDFDEMPEDCWEDISRVCEERGEQCGVIWLTNLDGPRHPLLPMRWFFGRCPDCCERIPRVAQDGDECKNCGHVFWRPKDDDDGPDTGNDQHAADVPEQQSGAGSAEAESDRGGGSDVGGAGSVPKRESPASDREVD